MSWDHELSWQGENLHIAERLVVAPAWGRLRMRPFQSGQTISEGTIIGLLLEGDEETPLVCNHSAIFLAWLAEEGERLSPGRRIAAIRVADG